MKYLCNHRWKNLETVEKKSPGASETEDIHDVHKHKSDRYADAAKSLLSTRDEKLPVPGMNQTLDRDNKIGKISMKSKEEGRKIFGKSNLTMGSVSPNEHDEESNSSTKAVCGEASAHTNIDTNEEARSEDQKETEKISGNGDSIGDSQTTQDSETDAPSYNTPITPIEERAVRFLSHPSIQNLNTVQKTIFLKEHCGLTKYEIDRALLYQAASENFNSNEINLKGKGRVIPTTQQRLNNAFVDSAYVTEFANDRKRSERNGLIYSRDNFPGPREFYHTNNGSVVTPAPNENYGTYGAQHQPQNNSLHSYNQHNMSSHVRNDAIAPLPLHHPEATRTPVQQRHVQSMEPRSTMQTMHPRSSEASNSNLKSDVKKAGEMTAVALCSAAATMFGMASWRWLNGGDFELLPLPETLLKHRVQINYDKNTDSQGLKDDNLTSSMNNSKIDDYNFMNHYQSAMDPGGHNDTFLGRDESHILEEEGIEAQQRVLAESIAELAEAVNDLRKSQENRVRKRESTMSTDSAMGFLRASKAKESKTCNNIKVTSDVDMLPLDKSTTDTLNHELIEKLGSLSSTLSRWIEEQSETDDTPVQQEIQDIEKFISNLSKSKESNLHGIVNGLT